MDPEDQVCSLVATMAIVIYQDMATIMVFDQVIFPEMDTMAATIIVILMFQDMLVILEYCYNKHEDEVNIYRCLWSHPYKMAYGKYM